MGSMIPLPKMRQYDIKYIEYVRNKKVKRFDKTMPNCLICWDIIDQKTHICCNICDIRMHANCDRKYRELTTTSKACPHCRQLGTQTICISITKEV